MTNHITSKGIIKLDRRKPLQEGTPQEDRFICNNNIKFDTQQNKWTCQRCNQTYGHRSMRNAIQHARHHITPRNNIQKKDQWHEGTEEENLLRDCRIQTLQNTIHGKQEEEEEKEKRNGQTPTEPETAEAEQNLILHLQKTTMQEHNNGKGQAKENKEQKISGKY